MQASKDENRIHVVADGISAPRFLRRTGEFGRRTGTWPFLLDLSLSGRYGLEILADIRTDPTC